MDGVDQGTNLVIFKARHRLLGPTQPGWHALRSLSPIDSQEN